MVKQPAYLTNLKAYAKAKYGSDEETDEAVADLSNESDRGAIILAATSIEDCLELKILDLMPVLKTDEQMRKKLFENDGAVSSFSRKNEMAYALGIISQKTRKEIDLIREIRNACAHSRKPLSMERLELLEASKAVIRDMLDHIKDHNPKTIRMAFIVKCGFIAQTVIDGKNYDGPDKQIEYFRNIKI